MCFFWTTSLVLYTVLRMSCEPEVLRDLPDRTDPLYHARFVADALGILLEPRAGLYGQQSAALPLEIALEYTSIVTNAGISSDHDGEIEKRLRTLKAGLTSRLDVMDGRENGLADECFPKENKRKP